MQVPTFKLVSEGVFEEEKVIELFMEAGKYPGTSATRRIDHNITDLQGAFIYSSESPGLTISAAVSANARGSNLVQRLFDQFGTSFVLFYMKEIQRVAQETVKSFLRQQYDQFGGKALRCMDYVSKTAPVSQ